MDMTIPHALVKASQKIADYDDGRTIDFFCSEQLSATYDQEQHAVWLRMTPQPRPSFNPELLRDLGTYCRLLGETQGSVQCRGGEHPVEYAVLASATPHVFNLGGDLALFMRLIEAGDRAGLTQYGRACVEVLYSNYRGHGLPILTISLVQASAWVEVSRRRCPATSSWRSAAAGSGFRRFCSICFRGWEPILSSSAGSGKSSQKS